MQGYVTFAVCEASEATTIMQFSGEIFFWYWVTEAVGLSDGGGKHLLKSACMV